jgi:hypothetical protein
MPKHPQERLTAERLLTAEQLSVCEELLKAQEKYRKSITKTQKHKDTLKPLIRAKCNEDLCTRYKDLVKSAEKKEEKARMAYADLLTECVKYGIPSAVYADPERALEYNEMLVKNPHKTAADEDFK